MRSSTSTSPAPRSPRRFLRLPAVIERTGLGRDSIYRLAREDRFPRPVKLSEHASGWLEEEVEAWAAARVAESRGTTGEAEPQRAVGGDGCHSAASEAGHGRGAGRT
jgi:prophage regulatory protein